MGKTKVLLTGGFGALGYNLYQRLKKTGNYEIYIIDNLSSGIANFLPGVSYSHLDIGNSEKMSSFFKNYEPNLIFHLAAHFANQNSVDHPISDTQTNVLGTINLFETQKKNKKLKKIIFASSSCVYGNNDIMTEDECVYPHETPYAINKYVGELYSKYYAEIFNIPVICARIFNSYGPGEMPGKYRNVIPNFIQKALHGEDIVITGTGEETRDFTFVSDTIDLLIKLADSQFTKGEIFNGGTGNKTSIKYLAETIIRLTNSSSKIVYTPRRVWDHVKDRHSDISKSKEYLVYSPDVELEHGLVETIKWIRSKISVDI